MKKLMQLINKKPRLSFAIWVAVTAICFAMARQGVIGEAIRDPQNYHKFDAWLWAGILVSVPVFGYWLIIIIVQWLWVLPKELIKWLGKKFNASRKK